MREKARILRTKLLKTGVPCSHYQAMLLEGEEGGELSEIASQLTLSNQKTVPWISSYSAIRIWDCLQYGERRVFPITQQEWNAKIPDFYSFQRDAGKNNIIHQQEVIKGSCDHF